MLTRSPLHHVSRARDQRPRAFAGQSGFTLMELMVVVVIISILSVVAVVSYAKYKQSARKGEGVGAVSDIRIKQETFFATYSRYEDSTGGFDETVFDGTLRSEPDFRGFYSWEVGDCPDPGIAWCNLGFTPPTHEAGGEDNLTYFQLQTMGWRNGAAAPSFIANPAERWVSATARGLPDKSSLTHCVTIRLTSENSDVVTLTGQDCD